MDKSVEKFLQIRVPRYTSYPTAPNFSSLIGVENLQNWLSALPPHMRLSLYLHIPFCRKMCWYCGCNMRLTARYEPVSAYVERLIEEIRLVAAKLPGRHIVTHIHWGGGTPTVLKTEDIARITDVLRSNFDISSDAETAVEIDPRTLSDDMPLALAKIGCNRASLGVQEFDQTVQQSINRIQPFSLVERATRQLRACGIGEINFDLIYGLPHQTLATLAETVRKTATLRPQRIALFGYAHVPWMAKNQRMIDEKALPDAALRIEMAEVAADLIERAGYRRIGIDHFALPDDSLAVAAETGRLRRNFQGYTTDDASVLIGFGASAISALPQGYTQNTPATGAYMRAIESGRLAVAKGVELTTGDTLRRHLIERLMCDFRVDIQQSCERFGFAIDDLKAAITDLQPFLAGGFATLSDNHLSITERGRPLTRAIASSFDAYLTNPERTHRHSSL